MTELAALGTTWFAIGSTATVDARDNTGTLPSTEPGGSLGGPIFLLNDTKLVDSNDDLWDASIDIVFDVNEDGTPHVPAGQNTFVFTGTNPDGTAYEGWLPWGE